MRVRGVLAGAVVSAVLATAPAAVGQERRFTLLSGNGGPHDVSLAEVSADGSTVLFRTAEDLPGTADRDGLVDLYRWRDGKVTLLTGSGAAAGSGHEVERVRVSPDGSRFLYQTTVDFAGPGDDDGLRDVFAVGEEGDVRLLTGSTPASRGGADVWLVDTSTDLSQIYVTTQEGFAGDDDGLHDGFRIDAGGATLLTGSRPASSGGADAYLADVSENSGHVWFATTEDVPGTEDGDGLRDIYRAGPDGVTVATTTSANRGDTSGPYFLGASPDGWRIMWATQEDVPQTGDTDGLLDVYSTLVSPGLRLNTLMTASTPASAGGAAPSVHAVSRDADRVVFSTAENIPGSGDTDGLLDVYRSMDSCAVRQDCRLFPRWPGEVPTLLSSDHAHSSGGRHAFFADVADLLFDQVFFRTSENIPGTGDDDDLVDGYRADGSRISLVTGNRSAAAGGAPVEALQASRNGRFAFFTTREDVPGTGDRDGLRDHFRAGPDGVVSLTAGNPGPDWSRPVTDWGADVAGPPVPTDDDDERFVFVTAESLVGDADTDSAADVYLSTPAPPRPAPPAPAADPPAPTAPTPPASTAPAPAPTAGPPTTSAQDRSRGDEVPPAFTRGLRLRGGRLRFTLSEAARVTITISQERIGRRVDGRCRAPSRRTRGARRCTRQVLVGRVRRDARAGANAVRFSGRVVPHRLRPGRFRVVAVARDAAGNVSRPNRARFRLRAAGA